VIAIQLVQQAVSVVQLAINAHVNQTLLEASVIVVLMVTMVTRNAEVSEIEGFGAFFYKTCIEFFN